MLHPYYVPYSAPDLQTVHMRQSQLIGESSQSEHVCGISEHGYNLEKF